MPSLLIVIATFNEVDNLPVLVSAIFDLLPESKVLVIDDDSPDGTGQWCDEYRQREPRLEVIHRKGERGLGTATLAGLQRAMHGGFDLIATMDADLSHDPADLLLMLKRIKEDKTGKLGLVIGSRYVPGGRIMGWSWYRRLASKLVNGYVRLVLGLESHDNTSAFRVYRANALRRIELSDVVSKGYAYLEELLWRLQTARVKMAEVPIVFEDRKRGESKVRTAVLLSSLWQILMLSFRNLINQSKG
ncbi:MAG: polyprenol monophosphomannose synthase [Mariniblastus sp.]|nr:polyprenol monophosphomannose synthase [Mariniblastus sp.]